MHVIDQIPPQPFYFGIYVPYLLQYSFDGLFCCHLTNYLIYKYARCDKHRCSYSLHYPILNLKKPSLYHVTIWMELVISFIKDISFWLLFYGQIGFFALYFESIVGTLLIWF